MQITCHSTTGCSSATPPISFKLAGGNKSTEGGADIFVGLKTNPLVLTDSSITSDDIDGPKYRASGAVLALNELAMLGFSPGDVSTGE